MKKQLYFSGSVLLCFGIYFLMKHYQFSLFQDFYTWPTLITIVGIGFLANGYLGKEDDSILPGVVLTGIGIHLHVTNYLKVWPDHSGIFLLFIAIGLLLKYVKTGVGLIQGLIFLSTSLLVLFFDKFESWIIHHVPNLSLIVQAWPYLLIIIGLYFLFFYGKRRRG